MWSGIVAQQQSSRGSPGEICVFTLNHWNKKKMQFSTNSPQLRVQTSGLAPRRSVLLFWLFSYSVCQRSAFIELKSEIDLSFFICLADGSARFLLCCCRNGKKTVFMACIPGWLVKYLPSWSLCFLPQLPVPRVCTLGFFFFHAVKSCVKNLCRNSRAITYRNLFFCLMIQISKIWVGSGWMRADSLLFFFSFFLLNLSGRRRRRRRNIDAKLSTFPGSDTGNITVLPSCFFSNCAETQRWTRCSGWHYVTEGVDRQIFWIIKEEIICVILALVRMSVWAHPYGSFSVRTINICHADLRRAIAFTSIMATPSFFFRIFRISARKVKFPGVVLRSTFTNVFTKMQQNAKVYIVASSAF